MQVVIKKSVLFRALKKILHENRTGHSFYSDGSFLGRFEEEEEASGFINSDVPLRPNPEAKLQLHADNFDVSDPEFVPASKSSFLSAAAAVLEHVPENQIEKVYEKLHSLLDEAHEDEDKRNYGSLKEAFRTILIKESRDQYLQNALAKVNAGEDAEQVAIGLIEDYDEFAGEDYIELSQEIENMQLASFGYSEETQPKEPEVVQQPPPEIETPASEQPKRKPRRFVIRPGQKAELVSDEPVKTIDIEDPIDDDLEDVEKIDITDIPDKEATVAVAYQSLRGLGLLAMAIEPLELKKLTIELSDSFSPEKKAAEIKKIPHVKHDIHNYKTFFLYNYDSSSRKYAELFSSEEELTKLAKHQLRVAIDHGASFLEAPTIEYKEYDEEDDEELIIPDDASSTAEELVGDAGRAYDSAEDKSAFLAGYNAGADFDPDYGPIPDLSGKSTEYIDGFVFGHEDVYNVKLSLNEAKVRRPTLESQVAMDIHRKKVNQFKILKANIIDLQKKLGFSLDQTIDLVAKEVASIMVDNVKNLEFGTEDQKINQALVTSFASLVSYFDPRKGVNQKSAEGVKEYQANNSDNFYRNVKEEYREEIIDDFLELLAKKFLKGDVYRLASGRKDQSDPKGRRNEYYEIDPLTFRKAAEEYANKQINDGLKKQASGLGNGELETDIDTDSLDDPIASGEVDLDMAYALIEEQAPEDKQEIGGFYKKYAGEFGFSGASGMRQWFIKKPDRLFKMMVMSMMGNGVLSDLHSKTLITVLKIVADQLPDIVHTKIVNGKPVVDYENHDPDEELENLAQLRADSGEPELDSLPPEYEEIFERFFMKESISDIEQAIEQLKTNKGILLTDIMVNSGGKQIRFVSSPGGRLVINLNALIYDKFLVKFDKDYTDFVSDKLLNDKTVQIEMENVLGTEPTITPKIAKSLAEYFTGKKEKPVLEVIKETDEEGDTFERYVFKKNEDGKYPNKGGAAKLLAQGIDGQTFNYLFNKVSDHLKNTALQSFKPTVEFEKQRKSKILINYKTSVVDPMLEKFEEKGVNDQIRNAVKEIVSFHGSKDA